MVADRMYVVTGVVTAPQSLNRIHPIQVVLSRPNQVLQPRPPVSTRLADQSANSRRL